MRSEEIGFQVAAGSVDITPQRPLTLAGYAHRTGRFERIADPLEANVMLLYDSTGVVAFVTLDLLYVGGALRKKLVDRLSAHLAPEAILVSASHTHFAPATDPLLPRLGAADPSYVDYVADQVAGLAERLLKSPPTDATLEYVAGSTAHAVNRRVRTFRLGRDFPFLKTRWEMRPNFNGSRDDSIHLLALRDGRGELLAVCWNYACHPVCFPEADSVSADFIGVVRSHLRSELGVGPVLYWQGFSGNLRPRATKRAPGRQTRGQERAVFAPFTTEGWNSWAQSLAAKVVELTVAASTPVRGKIRACRWSVPLSEFGLRSSGREISVQEVQIGDALSILGVSAELACEYGAILASTRKSRTVIPIGCIDAVPGYLPTDAMVAEGGYEAEGFRGLFGVSGRFRTNLEEVARARLFEQPLG